MSVVPDLVALSRPRHWLKNAFVLMPLPFALASGARFDLAAFGAGLAAMCLASSAVYAFNDVVDAERDRHHPRKRSRAVAAGRVSPGMALAWSATLIVAGGALVWSARSANALLVILAYLAINVVYSMGAKNVPLVDVFLLSAGFVVRVLLGCALIGVQPSSWLLLCSSSLALFMALAKRRGDLSQGLDLEHRPSLAGYSREFLDHTMSIMAAVTLVAYALYTMEAEVLTPGREFATLPFAFGGVLEYLRRVFVRGEGAAPVEVILSSPGIAACAIGWGIAAIWSTSLAG